MAFWMAFLTGRAFFIHSMAPAGLDLLCVLHCLPSAGCTCVACMDVVVSTCTFRALTAAAALRRYLQHEVAWKFNTTAFPPLTNSNQWTTFANIQSNRDAASTA